MTSVFAELNDQRLTAELEAVLLPRLIETLRNRAPGHCIRVADLDQGLMVALTDGLRRDVSSAQVYMLTDRTELARSDDRYVTSTKLVELRNPNAEENLRPALLVFLPSNLRTSAEDSFSVATFEELPVTSAYDELLQRLQSRIPAPLQGTVRLLFDQLGDWFVGHIEARVRFLLTAIVNGADHETLGAALYEIGLVPDLRLFNDQTRALGRIQQNVRAVRSLTTSDLSIRGRVLDLNLVDKTLQRRIMQLLLDTGTSDPRRWTRQIILDRKNWELTFDKWRFADERNPDKIGIFAVKTDLPVVREETDSRLQGFVGQQLLTPQTRRKLTLTFQVTPHPSQVAGLDYFTVQLMAREAGTGNISTPLGLSKRVKAWKAKRTTCTVTLDKLNRVAFPDEGGWCFLRVLPWTADGDPVPTETVRSQINDDTFEAIPSNESEPFFVIPGETDFEEEERPQRAIPRADSVQHARLRVQFKVAREGRDPSEIRPDVVAWEEEKTPRPRVRDMLRVTFRGEGVFNVPVVHSLQQLETQFLTRPTELIQLELCIENGRLTTVEREAVILPDLASSRHFLAARADYFVAVRAGAAELISQAADYDDLYERCIQYAKTYRDLLRDLYARVEASVGNERTQALHDTLQALLIDTIQVKISQARKLHRTRFAALLSPLHPIRALWFATWTAVSQRWLSAARQGSPEYIGIVEDAILRRLAPLNVPPTLIRTADTIYTPVDNISPFWALYAEPTEEDVRGLFSEVCAALQATEPAFSGAAVTGEALATRIERYLNQHPYVRTLTLNVFNPGRAKIIAEALVWLQKQPSFEQLRYDIRLFVPDREAPGIGEAVLRLLSPDLIDRTDTDVFGISTGSHLYPKLSLAVRGMDEFRNDPEGFRAHLSILLDVFPATTIGAGQPLDSLLTVPLYGLTQEFVSHYSDQESDRSFWLWQRQPCHGELSQQSVGINSAALLAELPKLISGLTATIVTRDPVIDYRPTISLSLSPEQRALLHRVHEVSDWVCTIDRNLGIEFFDHARTDRPEYLIDYVPGKVTSGGHRLIVTTRSVVELSALLRPVLDSYGLPHQNNQVALVLRQLRLLSGRLALKLISLAPSQRAEALGLALAYRYLDQQQALQNQILVPLDDHIDLFRQAGQTGDEGDGSESLHRTDLALFELDLPAQTLICRLIEVKCYAHATGVAAYQQLKEIIGRQIDNSQLTLRRQFDPAFDPTKDRPDRALKTRELALLLEFYLERSVRYGLMSAEAAGEGRTLLATLEDGYSFIFTHSALIFDFMRDGTEAPDREENIEYHRIGANLIRGLLSMQHAVSVELDQADVLEDNASSIPFLQDAAFLSPRQDRTTTQELLDILPIKGAGELSNNGADTKDTGIYVAHDIASSGSNHEITGKNSPSVSLTNDRVAPPLAETSLLEGSQSEEAPQIQFVESQEHRSGPAIHESGSAPDYDVLLGVQADSVQYGILGEVAGRKVALDLDQTHTISLFGVQGGGKSYTLGSIIEMACLPIPHINQLLNPLATILFHYSATKEYKPEFVTMNRQNTVADQIAPLRERYQAQPQALRDIVLLTPKAQLDERRAEYPDITVEPMTFSSAELKASHWKFLMRAVGNQSLYLRQINLIIRRLRNNLMLDQLLDEVERSPMADHMKETARVRLQLAAEYIDDSRQLGSLVRSGRLIIVDLRDDTIEKDEALGLFVVLLQIFSEASQDDRPFNKLVVFDEAHKYMENPDLVAGLIEVVREMRHKGTSILVASQEPRSVPQSLIELSSQIILHRFNSPDWLRYIQKTNTALSSLTPEKMNSLGPGEAYVWSSKASDSSFSTAAVKIRCRPRVTQHGGATKTAVSRIEKE
jgi:DNA phosphorothioation-dependent restriction protein DptH